MVEQGQDIQNNLYNQESCDAHQLFTWAICGS